MNVSKKLFICAGLVSVVALPVLVGADSFNTLSEIPGLEAAAGATDGGFAAFINSIYRMSIGIGAALAVIMIIFAGIQYSMSAVSGKKAEYKDRIGMALGGLALLIGAFVFLEFINPDLTDLSPERLQEGRLVDGEFVPYSDIVDPGTDDESDLPIDPSQPVTGPQ